MSHVQWKAHDDQLGMAERVMKADGVCERWTSVVLHDFQDVPPVVLDVSYCLSFMVVLGLAHAPS